MSATSAGARAAGPRKAEDRRGLPAWRLVASVVLTGASVGLAASSIPSRGGPGLALMAGASAAALAVFGLPSVPLRWAVRMVVLLGAAIALGLGALQDGTGRFTSSTLTIWAGVSVAALVVSSSRAGVARGARFGVAAVALVCAAAILLGPGASERFVPGPSAAERLNRDDLRVDNPLVATEQLDMRRRPRLTERQVMTVRADRRAFWRTATFDVWDGTRWTRSRGRVSLVEDGRVDVGPREAPAGPTVRLRQRFELDVGFASSLPAAATPTRVETVGPVGQFSDATLVAVDEPLGEGSRYEVTSVLPMVTEAQLRAAGRLPVPEAVAARYAAEPVATPRVRVAAAEIVEQARRSTPEGEPVSSYDIVRAAETWMGQRTEYSLDAPLPDGDVDVVDDFLFESRLGWCEQIASSLVVLVREAGVPARLATGYVPGEWDPVAGRFVVRERDAHAWAEVWFPDVGWISFDPTADVPLSGEAGSLSGADAATGLVATALVVVAALVLAAPVARDVAVRIVGSVGGRLARARERRRRARGTWDQRAELGIEDLGAGLGRERRDGETLPVYASVVAEIAGDDSLPELAARIEQARYAPVGAPAPGSDGPADG